MTPPRKAAAGGCASGVAGGVAAALAGAALRTVTVRRLFPAEIVVLIASASDSSQWMSACTRGRCGVNARGFPSGEAPADLG